MKARSCAAPSWACRKGELEAARAFGMSPWKVLRRIWFPRAVRLVLPTLGGETVLQLKSTPLAFTVTVMDLMGVTSQIRQDTFRIFEPLMLLAVDLYVPAPSSSSWVFNAPRTHGSAEAMIEDRTIVDLRRTSSRPSATISTCIPNCCSRNVRTSAIVARELRRLGYKVTTGIAGTGVVGTLSNGTSAQAASGIRADMDALPIHETTDLPYASQHPGKMHACGHDGHTTMLLGAARYLAETRNFNGTVHLIFQPAEEDVERRQANDRGGAVQALSVRCGLRASQYSGHDVGPVPAVRPGAIMAAVDIVKVIIRGVGGHGAMPHKAVDPIVAASSS